MSAKIIRLKTERRRRRNGRLWPRSAGYWSNSVRRQEAMREMALFFDRTVGNWLRRLMRLTMHILRQNFGSKRIRKRGGTGGLKKGQDNSKR